MDNNKERKDIKESPGLIEPHGGYQNLKSYQTATKTTGRTLSKRGWVYGAALSKATRDKG